VFHLCLAALVWAYNRQDQPPLHRRLTFGLLLLCCIAHSLIFQALFFVLGLRSWELLGAKALLVGLLAGLSLVVYSGLGTKAGTAWHGD
jgi:hypothetical protein